LSGMVNKVVFIDIPDSLAWKGGSEKISKIYIIYNLIIFDL
jgi:hypothetical protein